MSKLNLKQGQVLMMMGTVGELPKEPEKPTVFLEDMTDSQLAEVVEFDPMTIGLDLLSYSSSSLIFLTCSSSLASSSLWSGKPWKYLLSQRVFAVHESYSRTAIYS